MFSKQTYVSRRTQLKKLIKSGIIILFGNNESPANFPANAYYPFRQDSSFLYYFGQQRDGLVGIIDIDNDKEVLVGDDIDIEDIVWYGSVDSVHDMAEQIGVANTAPMKALKTICNDALRTQRPIHFLPPYRADIQIQLFDLLGIHPSQQKESASMELIKAVVKMRSTKTAEEIDELERAAVIGYKMHITGMMCTRPGLTEKNVGGQIDGTAHSFGSMVSFPTIFSQHGEIMHGNPSMDILESGRVALCDAGGVCDGDYAFRAAAADGGSGASGSFLDPLALPSGESFRGPGGAESVSGPCGHGFPGLFQGLGAHAGGASPHLLFHPSCEKERNSLSGSSRFGDFGSA